MLGPKNTNKRETGRKKKRSQKNGAKEIPMQLKKGPFKGVANKKPQAHKHKPAQKKKGSPLS